MRVYYLTDSRYALSNIERKHLKVARVKDLNDPFELLALTRAKRKHRQIIKQRIDQIHATEALLCFTVSWHNPVHWSHYGDKHKGIALGFDVPDDKLNKVNYIKNMYDLSSISEKSKEVEIDELLKLLRQTKFNDWRYEDEVRQFFKLEALTATGALHFAPFNASLKLREIILGPRCETKIECIRELVNTFPEKVDVIKARIAFKRFRVVKDLRYQITDLHTQH